MKKVVCCKGKKAIRHTAIGVVVFRLKGKWRSEFRCKGKEILSIYYQGIYQMGTL